MVIEPSVRPAEASDFDAWYALAEEVAREGRWIGMEAPLERDQLLAGFHRLLDPDRGARFVAEIGGLLVGDLGVGLHGGVADLGMMVRDGYRGQGVGSALMEACLAWCRGTSAHKVTLTVWPHNERGRALYRKFGFAEEGRLVRHMRRRTGELWDAIPMGLVLDHTSPGSPFEDAKDTGGQDT